MGEYDDEMTGVPFNPTPEEQDEEATITRLATRREAFREAIWLAQVVEGEGGDFAAAARAIVAAIKHHGGIE